MVRDLAPAGLDGDDATGVGRCPRALRRVADGGARARRAGAGRTAPRSPVPRRGERPRPVGAGRVANVVEHADAARAVVSLTYHLDEVLLDVRDDGRGFDPPPGAAVG